MDNLGFQKEEQRSSNVLIPPRNDEPTAPKVRENQITSATDTRRANLVVPPRRNGKPWKARTTGADERNETIRAIRHLGRRLWKRWSGYHRRSLAETAMSRLKRLGERLSARDPARQVAEVQIRCAILNTFNALGMPDTVART